MSTPIEIVKFDPLIEGLLMSAGYDTLEALLSASTAEILQIEGVSALVLYEINQSLDDHGVVWTGEAPKPPPLDEVVQGAIAYRRAVNAFLLKRSRRNYRSLCHWRQYIRRHFPSLSDVEVHRFSGVILEVGGIALYQTIKSQPFIEKAAVRFETRDPFPKKKKKGNPKSTT